MLQPRANLNCKQIKCCICFHVFKAHKFSKNQKQKLIEVEARTEAYIESGVYIVNGSRCCSKYRTKSQALAIYLFWLKTGMTQETIAAYFGGDLEQRDISHLNEQVRTHLDEFVNKNYGSKHLTR